MNQYLIILLVWLASLVGVGLYANSKGHASGVNEQKAVDQLAFDKINEERTHQAIEANAIYRGAQERIIALQVERDKLKNKLGAEYVANQKATADLADEYARRELRFRAPSARPGADGAGADSSGSDAASAPAGPVVQLPETVTRDLRQLAKDADDLKDAYGLCRDYVTQVK
jgi:hypothetical protein